MCDEAHIQSQVFQHFMLTVVSIQDAWKIQMSNYLCLGMDLE